MYNNIMNNKGKIGAIIIFLGLIFATGFFDGVYAQTANQQGGQVFSQQMKDMIFSIEQQLKAKGEDIQNFSLQDLDWEALLKNTIPSIPDTEKAEEEMRNKMMQEFSSYLENMNNNYYKGDFSFNVTPKNPDPNTNVNINLMSDSFDINRSDIKWTINGNTKWKGIGEKNFNFLMGNIGSKTVVAISVTSLKGDRFLKTINFYPANVDILWEAENYVPVSYKGKALPSQESLIKVTAIPNFLKGGVKMPSSELFYDWQIDYKKLPSASGRGKQSMYFVSSKIGISSIVNVVISDLNNNIRVEKNITIEPQNPKVVFYKENPLEGKLYNQAIDEANDGDTIVAEPYFFSNNQIDNLSYEWLANKKNKIESNIDKNKIKVLLDSNNSDSVSNIYIRILNKINTFQSADKIFRINLNRN